jgi:hypothetical protein
MASRSTLRSGTTKSLIYSLLCMLFGVILLVGGMATWKNPAQCGGQTMQQGDTCEVTQNGSTSDNSMSQQESSNHREAIIMFVLGPLMVLGGGVWFGSEIRIRRRRDVPAKGGMAIAGAGPFPGQGQYPSQPSPQMYNPAQAMGQNPYAAPVQQPYAAAQPYGFPQQQPLPQQQYGVPQAQQFGAQQSQAQPQPQAQAYGVPPQQGWPAQQWQQPQQAPQQGTWQGQQPPQQGTWQGN